MTPTQFRAIRKKCRWQQKDAATFLRVTEKTVSNYETGNRQISGPVAILMELLDDGKI